MKRIIGLIMAVILVIGALTMVFDVKTALCIGLMIAWGFAACHLMFD